MQGADEPRKVGAAQDQSRAGGADRASRAHARAKATHERAAVLHTEAAELYEEHADTHRERGDADRANEAETSARREHEKAAGQMRGAELEQERLEGRPTRRGEG